eukprot:jgi/Mesvir1/10735/Mv13807-RA.2
MPPRSHHPSSQILFHFYKETSSARFNGFSAWGPQALSFFFVLSGFVLAYQYAASGRRIANVTAWMVKRIAHLYPAMIASIVLMLPILPSSAIEPKSLVTVLFSVQAWRTEHFINAYNIPAWTVGAFVLCYALFPTARDVLASLGHVSRTVVALALYCYSLWSAAWASGAYNNDMFVFNPINVVAFRAHVPEFLLGVTLGVSFVQCRESQAEGADDGGSTTGSLGASSENTARRFLSKAWMRVRPLTATACVTALLVIFSTVDPRVFSGTWQEWVGRGMLSPVSAAIICSLASGTDMLSGPLSCRPARFLGTISYGLYIYQAAAHAYSLRYFPPVSLAAHSTELHALAFFAALAGTSVASHYLLERPAEALVVRAHKRLRAAFPAVPSLAVALDSLCSSYLVLRLALYYGAMAGTLVAVAAVILGSPAHWPALFSGSLATEDLPYGMRYDLADCRGHWSAVDTLVDILKWASLSSLPMLVFNVAGHVLWPAVRHVKYPALPPVTPGAGGAAQAVDTTRGGMKAEADAQVEAVKAEEAVSGKPTAPTVAAGGEPAAMMADGASASNVKDGNAGDRDMVAIPLHVADETLPGGARLFFRIVTRGCNPNLVARNAQHAFAVLFSCLPRCSFRVEVVTDNPLALSDRLPAECEGNVYELLVPSSFSTKTGAKYKARALHFAILASPADSSDWIVHLDEETSFGVDTVEGIVAHCTREAGLVASGRQVYGSIGQGVILYGRVEPIEHYVNTLADCVRVADDYGKFRLQYQAGEAWIGMHGSYVVCSNAVEKAVGFDHGVQGSITEDAYFALMARARGVHFRWIDRFMYEQSPFSVMDFIRQRRRWFGGLVLVCRAHTDIPFHHRAILAIMVASWALAPLVWLGVLVNILFASTSLAFSCLLVLNVFLSCWGYLLGFAITFRLGATGILRYLSLMYLLLLLQPLFAAMEVAGVVYALIVPPVQGFYIVQKEKGANAYKGNTEDRAGSSASSLGDIESACETVKKLTPNVSSTSTSSSVQLASMPRVV